MKIKHIFRVFLATLLFLTSIQLLAQSIPEEPLFFPPSVNLSPSFLQIIPDARSSAMGLSGVASESSSSSIFFNAAKDAFISDSSSFGFNLSLAPQRSEIFIDSDLITLTAYRNFNGKSAVSFSARMHRLESIAFTNIIGTVINTANPREYGLDLAYSRKLSKRISLGITGRYLFIDNDYSVNGSEESFSHLSADISLYHRTNPFTINGQRAQISSGLAVNNLGPTIDDKILFFDKAFLPTTLRAGSSLTIDYDGGEKLITTVEFSKLLTPTQGFYVGDRLMSGIDASEYSALDGILNSFTDSPGEVYLDDESGNYLVKDGSKLKEELREISLSLGAEFYLVKYVALRAGLFYQHESKGIGTMVTTGLGFNYKYVNLDIAFLSNIKAQDDIVNSIVVSLGVNIR